MQITASVFINDDEPGLHAEYERWLEEPVPFNPGSDPPAKTTPTPAGGSECS